jgi:hypothetical protein
MPDFYEQPTRSGSPTPSERMAAHSSGGEHEGMGCVGKCRAWRDAHLANVLAVFRTENPTVVNALRRAE